MAKLPEEISTAMTIAENTPGWSVSTRNGKIVIVAPNGTALTTTPTANDESLKVWRAQARKYNLVGEGPAMTPEQQEMAMADATPIDSIADKKATEAAEAEKKAALAAAGKGPTPGAPRNHSATVPAMTFTPPAAPVATHKVVAPVVDAKKAAFDKDGFPPFVPEMLVIRERDYSHLQLKTGPNKGRFFCGNCWEHGDKEVFKAPQGLSSHRGFRHAAFIIPAEGSQDSAKLPEGIETALELLRGALIEELTDTADANQLRSLEKKVKELNGLLKERDTMVTDLEKKLSDASRAQQAAEKLSAERGTALDKAKGEYEAQVKMLLSRVEKDLQQMQTWANELAPVKAVGQIMNVVERYLDK